MDNKGRWVAVWIGLFLAISTVGGFLIKGIIDDALYNRFPDRGVPRINIDLNGVSLEEVKSGPKEMKYEGNDLQIYNGGEIMEYGGVEVKGRGNSTWVQEKKPFQIKFENKVDMFGMGEAKKWYLLANALDGTNLRTDTAFYLEQMLGMTCGLKGEFAELYIDEEYLGLYYLTRAVEIEKGVVNLRNDLGVLVELDNVYGKSENYYETGNGDLLVLKDVVSRDKTEEAMKNFLKNYNEFEMAMMDGNYEEVSKLIDVRSFAEYYLLSEFTVNPDAYWTSFYMYKDGLNDKIHAGPGWDFDLAFANRVWGNWMGEEFYSPTKTMVRRGELLPKEIYEEMGLVGGDIDWYGGSLSLSKIIYGLMDIPEFKEEVMKIYNERLAGRDIELIKRIRGKAEKIYWVAEKNDEKWTKTDHEEETEMMVDWVKKRYEYFEKEYSDGVEKVKIK